MNKKIITATLLISDGPVEHSYFSELLDITNDELISILKEINSEIDNIELGFEIKYDNTKSDIKTISEISTYLKDIKPASISDIVFATDGLDKYLNNKKIDHYSFDDFNKVLKIFQCNLNL